MISGVYISKRVIGFRECAKIKQIADTNGSQLNIVANQKSGTSESILSLFLLSINVDTLIILSVHGGNERETFNVIHHFLKSDE